MADQMKAAVVLEAVVGQAVSDMNSAAKAMVAALQQMGAGTKALRPANDEAKASVVSFTDKLQQFKAEQVQQSRTARFFANELMSIVPAASAGGEAMRDLAGVLVEGAAGGTGFGLALEGTKLIVGVFTRALHEAEEQAKKTADATAKVSEEAEKIRRQNLGVREDQVSSGRLEAAKHALALRDEANLRLRDAEAMTDESRAAEELLDSKRALIAAMEKQLGLGVGGLDQWVRAEEELAKQQRTAAQLETKHTVEELEGRQRLIGLTSEQAKVWADFENERISIQTRYKGKLDEEHLKHLAINNAIADRVEKLRLLQIKSAFSVTESTESTGYDLSHPPSWVGDEKDIERHRVAAIKAQFSIPSPNESEGYDLSKSTGDMDAAEKTRKFQEELKKTKARSEELAATAGTIGDAFGKAFAGMTLQSKSFASAMQSMAKSVLSAILGAIRKEVMGEASLAAVKAFNSQGSIPIVGPVLGFAAAAAAFAFAQGMIDKIPSAAGGWAIPMGVNPIVQAHEGEHVIPREIAQRYEAGAPGGSGPLTINIHAMDARSFEQSLNANDSVLLRTLSRLARDGRLG